MADIRKQKLEDYVQQLIREELTKKESYLKKQRERNKRDGEKVKKETFRRER